MAKKFYISTPLYYVNAKPHIGHSYTEVACDAAARFMRQAGAEVFLMTGTDAFPVGRLPASCVTPQQCQWALAEGTAAGRTILANGVGGYRLGAHARPWLAEWQGRVS